MVKVKHVVKEVLDWKFCSFIFIIDLIICTVAITLGLFFEMNDYVVVVAMIVGVILFNLSLDKSNFYKSVVVHKILED